MPQKTIGLYLLDRLHQHGVQHIFGVPGDYVLRFDKLIEEHVIQYINATRENTAGCMADAYARIRGLGVACITYGVGINIANAVAQAYVESSPVVIISGALGTQDLTKESYHYHHLIHQSLKGYFDTTQLEIFKQITIDQALLHQADTAASEIDRVLESCLTHKKPVYIELPRNLVNTPIPKHTPHHIMEPSSNLETLHEAIEEVADLLQNARHPLLWIGHEIQRFGLASSVLHFAEKYNIPIVTSLLGKTAVSEHHPLFIGVYQGEMSRPEVSAYVNRCDCVLQLGVLLSDMDTGMFSAKLDQETRIVADCQSVKIRHHSYDDIAFPEFVQALAQLKLKVRFPTNFPAYITNKNKPFVPKQKKITSDRFFQCLQKHLRPEHIVVADIGDSLFGSINLMLEQDSYVACAYFGSLGFATPGAVGAQIAAPQRRVIAIVGDGAFQMTSMELSTAVRYHLDPIIIVLNNHGYGTERPLLEGTYNDIVDWRYTEIPRVLGGGTGIRVTTEEECENALTTALETRGEFTLIEIVLDKTDFSPTMQRFLKLVKSRT